MAVATTHWRGVTRTIGDELIDVMSSQSDDSFQILDNPLARRGTLAVWDAGCWTLATAIVLGVRLDFAVSDIQWRSTLRYLAITMAVLVAFGYFTKFYRGRFRVGSFDEVTGLAGAVRDRGGRHGDPLHNAWTRRCLAASRCSCHPSPSSALPPADGCSAPSAIATLLATTSGVKRALGLRSGGRWLPARDASARGATPRIPLVVGLIDDKPAKRRPPPAWHPCRGRSGPPCGGPPRTSTSTTGDPGHHLGLGELHWRVAG